MKPFIPIMIILLMTSISFVGVSNQTEELMINKNGRIINQNNIGYGYCTRDPNGQLIEGPVCFYSDDPGNVFQLWGTSSPAPMTGGTWTWGGWYCCEYGSGDLWKIDWDSGYMVEIGGGGVHLNGLTWTADDVLLGSSNTSLYSIDEYNGDQTLIGSFGLPEGRRMGGIAFDYCNHHLYGVECDNNDLYMIDSETGDTEFIGPLGIVINGTAELEFYVEDCTLYLSTFTTQGELYKVDKQTGECNLIGEFRDGAEISALTIDPDRFYQPTANFSWTPKNPQTGENIVFNASSSYDEGGYIKLYEWDWNYDLIFDENSTSPIASYVWNEKGFYQVTLLVHDNHNLIDTQHYVVNVGNFPPETPVITGSKYGKVGIEYNYTFVSTDQDGDDIWYHICWGDKEIIYIYGPYKSGQPITLSYIWTEKGIHSVQCKAKDVYDAESDWAYLDVIMPKNKPFIFNFPLLTWLFEHFPNVFLLLRYFTGE